MANIFSHFNSFLFNNKGSSWNSLQRKNKTATAKYIYSSVTTQTGPLGRRLSNPLISLRSLKTKESQVFFFANGPIKFKIQLYNRCIENFETVWTYLTSQETTLKFMILIGLFEKKTRESFVLEIVVIGQSSSKCPGSSSCTVIDIFSSVYWFAIFEGCTKTRSSKYLKANGEEA